MIVKRLVTVATLFLASSASFLHSSSRVVLSVLQKLSPELQRNLLVLFTAGLLFWSGLAAHLPTLPLYIQSVGANEQMVGTVMGAFAVGLLLSRQWLAQLADARGRKLVLLIGMASVAVAPLGYFMTQAIPLLIAIRAIHGISIAAFALAYSALVVDLSPPQHRGELIGYMSLVNPIGLALGPAMGGYIHEWFGFGPMFLSAAGLGIVGLICTAQVQEKPVARAIDRTTDALPFWRLLGDPRIRIPALILLLVGLTFGTLSTFVPLFIKEVGVPLNVGLFYTAVAIASFVIRLIAGPASDRYGRGPFISISLVCYVLSMGLLWQAKDSITFLLAGAVEGAGSGILIPMIAALMADRSLPHERGRTFGVCMVGFDVGIALAGPVLGAFAVHLGYRGLFGLCVILALLGLLIFLTCSSDELRLSLRFALGQGRDIYAVELREDG
ncbi:MAG: MFS transporter [Synechococcales cyanobacterium C42_A2020_086]|nr:MFS transporter [Synechococcales cyanobacterium C42_A2020_086]